MNHFGASYVKSKRCYLVLLLFFSLTTIFLGRNVKSVKAIVFLTVTLQTECSDDGRVRRQSAGGVVVDVIHFHLVEIKQYPFKFANNAEEEGKQSCLVSCSYANEAKLLGRWGYGLPSHVVGNARQSCDVMCSDVSRTVRHVNFEGHSLQTSLLFRSRLT